MEANYKNYLIEAAAIHIPYSDKWTGKVKISWNENGTAKTVPFDSLPERFSSPSEAELWGLQFGKEWIDARLNASYRTMAYVASQKLYSVPEITRFENVSSRTLKSVICESRTLSHFGRFLERLPPRVW